MFEAVTEMLASTPRGTGALQQRRSPEATRIRLLDATRLGLTQFGAQRLSMSDVADLAGVSRPTLYRYFPSKEELLRALAEHEAHRFDSGLSRALRGQSGAQRLDVALQFIVRYLGSYGLQQLVQVESVFVLQRIAAGFPEQRAHLARLIAESLADAEIGRENPPTLSPEDTADLVLRIAMSYFLIPNADRSDLLLALRAVVSVATGTPAPSTSERSA